MGWRPLVISHQQHRHLQSHMRRSCHINAVRAQINMCQVPIRMLINFHVLRENVQVWDTFTYKTLASLKSISAIGFDLIRGTQNLGLIIPTNSLIVESFS
jgi:hypothetical protein